MWTELAVAASLVLVIEGVIYALFPNFMQRMLQQMTMFPPNSLRTAGLFSALLGVALVWLIKS